MSAPSTFQQRMRRWFRKSGTLQWLYWLSLMLSYHPIRLMFVVLVPILGVLFGLAALGKYYPVKDPFIDFNLYLAYLGGLAAFGLVAVLAARLRWAAERARIRSAVGTYLALSSANPDHEACKRLMALVPCAAQKLGGSLGKLAGASRLWLCFLPGRLLVVSGSSGAIVEASDEELRQLHLVDSATRGRFPLVLGRPESGFSVLTVERLEDLVRVVNVLVKQGVTLRHLKEA